MTLAQSLMSGSQHSVPPRRKDEIERAGRQTRRLVYGSLNEVSFQSGLLRKAARGVHRCTGEIESRRDGAESRQTERVQPDMALQMEDTLAADIAELGRFDPLERALARTKAVQRVEAGGVACVDGGPLIPIPAVHVDWIGHARPRNCECASKRDRAHLYQLCWVQSKPRWPLSGIAAACADILDRLCLTQRRLRLLCATPFGLLFAPAAQPTWRRAANSSTEQDP